MGRVTQRTLARRLRLLCIIATAVEPLTPTDIIDELADDFVSEEDDTRRRVFYGDLRWLRDLGADIVYSHRAGGYVLYALPDDLLRLGEAVCEWRRR